tara:strand:- start:1955 stop:3232 length:1278 start_codon:yes stop_codon:yes gene_type:complete
MKSFLLNTWSGKILIIVILLISFWFLISKNIFDVEDELIKKYPTLEKKFDGNLLSSDSLIRNLENNYNVKFLPKTQFTNINYKKVKVNFNKHIKNLSGTFFIELENSNIWLIDGNGNIFKTKINNLLNLKNNDLLDIDKIEGNLKDVKILDAHLYEDILYVYFSEIIDGCKTINISSSSIKKDTLEFKKVFDSNECQENEIQLGKLTYYNHQGVPGLLVATNFFIRDEPKKYLSQDDNSVFGKILFFDLKNFKKTLFSKGHRAPQGLYAENDLILSTEHGPKGGDEINKIVFGENYGWPIASYGDYYMEENNSSSDKFSEKPFYLKSHAKNNFKEPIYAYVPSIGISEIIRLPNNFSNHFIDNFLIASLNGKSIYRVKFDKNYNKIYFSEKIFIGNRIRDIKYHYDTKTILLGLEYKGEIGILEK